MQYSLSVERGGARRALYTVYFECCEAVFYGDLLHTRPLTNPILIMLTQDFADIYTSRLVTYTTITLLVWDYIVTIDEEVTLIWLRKWNRATFIFALNRYATLAVAIWGVIALVCAKGTAESCRTIHQFVNVFLLVNCAVSAIIAPLRAFIMSGRKAWFAAMVFSIGLVPLVINLVYDIKYKATLIVGLDLCSAVVLVTRAAFFLVDLLILSLIWRKTWSSYINGRKANAQIPFVVLYFQDGTLVFLLFLALHVVKILNVFPATSNKVFAALGVLTLNLTPCIVSRCFFSLRRAQSVAQAAPSRFSQFKTASNMRIAVTTDGGSRHHVQLTVEERRQEEEVDPPVLDTMGDLEAMV